MTGNIPEKYPPLLGCVCVCQKAKPSMFLGVAVVDEAVHTYAQSTLIVSTHHFLHLTPCFETGYWDLELVEQAGDDCQRVPEIVLPVPPYSSQCVDAGH